MINRKLLILSIAFILNSITINSYSDNLNKDMVFVKGGNFSPPFSITNKFEEYKVKSFYIDKTLVTKREYLDFINKNQEWKKENIPELFVDENYLLDWNNLKEENMNEPVTYISWFAAKAYCKSQNKRLPTDLEWEYSANDEKNTDLSWYWKPFSDKLDIVSQDIPNSKGIHNFHNLVWEWTYDFNNSVINLDSRETTGDMKTIESFCGSTGNFKDSKDYPAFARYSFRSTLKADITLKGLGFRCAKDI